MEIFYFTRRVYAWKLLVAFNMCNILLKPIYYTTACIKTASVESTNVINVLISDLLAVYPKTKYVNSISAAHRL